MNEAIAAADLIFSFTAKIGKKSLSLTGKGVKNIAAYIKAYAAMKNDERRSGVHSNPSLDALLEAGERLEILNIDRDTFDKIKGSLENGAFGKIPFFAMGADANLTNGKPELLSVLVCSKHVPYINKLLTEHHFGTVEPSASIEVEDVKQEAEAASSNPKSGRANEAPSAEKPLHQEIHPKTEKRNSVMDAIRKAVERYNAEHTGGAQKTVEVVKEQIDREK